MTDNDWLWDGKPEKVQETIEEGHTAIMKAQGPELGKERVKDVVHCVVSLSKSRNQYDEGRAVRGKVLFSGPPAGCLTCHGNKGQGIQSVAPNLTDSVWLWGGTQKSIVETITNDQHSRMPAWDRFLDRDKLYIMAAYAWGLSNRDSKKTPTKKAEPAPTTQPADASAPAAASAPAVDKAVSDAKAAPVAEAKPTKKVEAAPVKIGDKTVSEANCKTCHGDVIPGAPVVGRKDDWAPRIKRGKDTLHKYAFEGFNSMSAKSGNSSLGDDEVKAAVGFMANESGAKF